MRTLYAIRDRVAQDLVTMQMYSVFGFKTDAQAVRYFADAILDEKSILAKHPNDYELIKVGTISDNGQLQPVPAPGIPEIVVTGDALVAANSNPNMEDQSPGVRLAR